MIKRLAFILPLLVILALALPLPVAALPASKLWESYATGVDADYEVYGNIWHGQTFTVNSESHSVVQLRILAYREGLPGTITLSVKAVDNFGLPTGADLTSGTFDGDTITTDAGGAWYGVTLTEVSLDYSETYAIVIRAEAGNADNSLHTRYDGTSASYTGGSEVTSSNGGISWNADTDDDLYFEVRGCALVELMQAQVFRGYLEKDDMLFTIKYYTTYTPYYPSSDSKSYFLIQLRSVGGATVLAQTVCQAWGYKPASIYLSADQCVALNPGAAYRIYLYGDFDEQPYAFYTLKSADWRGDDLSSLDSWVLTFARDMEEHYDAYFTTVETTSEVLNTEGGIIFVIGIPELSKVRPNLFQNIIYTPVYKPGEWTNVFDTSTSWTAQVGDNIANVMTNIGNIFGLEGKAMAGFLLLAIYLAIAVIVAGFGDAGIAAFLAIPFILLGAWLRVVDFAFVGVMATVVILLTMYSVWWSRT